jgi:hypothetical protein
MKKTIKERLKYSPSEQKLLNLIPLDGKRITTKELIARRYRGESLPFNAATITTGTLNSLIRKADHNRETFRVRKSGRKGPRPQEIWVEKRHGKVRAAAC